MPTGVGRRDRADGGGGRVRPAGGRGSRRPLQPSGPQGPIGPGGGTTGLEYQTGSASDTDLDNNQTLTATTTACTAGKTVTGGGYTITGGPDVAVLASAPSGGNTQWTVTVNAFENNQNVTLNVTAACATP